MLVSTFLRTIDLAKSARKSPIYVSGDHLHELFPPDPSLDVSRLLSFGLVGHQPLERSTEAKLQDFCHQNGIAYRTYHDSKHFVIYPTNTQGSVNKN